jgi:Uma2 family endonuclease
MVETAIVHPKVTPEEYLRMERESDEKHEYIFGRIIPMAGASTQHNRIVRNMLILLGIHLTDEYEAFAADQRVYNASTENYVYPDIVVVKGELEYADELFDTITNPLLVVEVSSNSTMKLDQMDKFLTYRKANSFKEYILVAQHYVFMEKFYQTAQGLWEIEAFTKLEESVHLKSVNITLQVKDIYKKVKFE